MQGILSHRASVGNHLRTSFTLVDSYCPGDGRTVPEPVTGVSGVRGHTHGSHPRGYQQTRRCYRCRGQRAAGQRPHSAQGRSAARAGKWYGRPPSAPHARDRHRAATTLDGRRAARADAVRQRGHTGTAHPGRRQRGSRLPVRTRRRRGRPGGPPPGGTISIVDTRQ